MSNELTDREKARLAYTTTPAQFDEIAESLGVSTRTVMRWSAADGYWRKIQSPELTQQVEARANGIAEAKAERDAILADQAREVAVDLRVGVIERHRKELQAIRALIMDAIRSRDLQAARFAKTTAQTLEILQRSERRAWGLDAGEVDEVNHTPVTIIIERA